MSQLIEFRTIMNSIKSVWERDKKASIVMLIGVNGSAYRLPGTKMMMAEDAEMMEQSAENNQRWVLRRGYL